jgi:ketosteroid isomerase-like protein
MTNERESFMLDQQTLLTRFMDEASIRNSIARFADSATRGDYDAFRTLWDDDGEFIIGKPPHGQSATGAANAVAMLRRLRTGRDFFVQFALPGVIEINGDDATTRCLVHEAARGPGESYYRNHCVAFDKLRRSTEGWVFTSRSFQYLWLDTSPYSGDAFPLFQDSISPRNEPARVSR